MVGSRNKTKRKLKPGEGWFVLVDVGDTVVIVDDEEETSIDVVVEG